jgi:putative endonuclease
MMKKSSGTKKDFGGKGEQIAQSYLRSKGYSIITINWNCKHGEIDIVARQADTWVFVEVRARHAENTEFAFESITPRKQRRVALATELYLSTNQLDDVHWRVDIIAVAMPRAGQPIVDHREDGLTWA